MNPEKLMKELRKIMQASEVAQGQFIKTFFDGCSDDNLVSFKTNGDFSEINIKIDESKLDFDASSAKYQLTNAVLESYNKTVDKIEEHVNSVEASMGDVNAKLKKMTSALGQNFKQQLQNLEDKQKKEEIFTSNSGGGAVSISLDQNGKMLILNIADELIDKDEKDLLEDLISKAIHDANKSRQKTS